MPPKAGQWTEPEKYRFLLQIIKQQGGQKLSIKYDQLDMPGRTPKALSEMWGKIKKEVEATSGGDNEGSAPDGNEDAGDGAKPPKKAAKGAGKPAAKKAKATPKKDVKVTPSKRKAEEVDEDIKHEDKSETSDSDTGGVKLEADHSYDYGNDDMEV